MLSWFGAFHPPPPFISHFVNGLKRRKKRRFVKMFYVNNFILEYLTLLLLEIISKIFWLSHTFDPKTQVDFVFTSKHFFFPSRSLLFFLFFSGIRLFTKTIFTMAVTVILQHYIFSKKPSFFFFSLGWWSKTNMSRGGGRQTKNVQLCKLQISIWEEWFSGQEPRLIIIY